MGLTRREKVAAAMRTQFVIGPHRLGHQRVGLRKTGQRSTQAEFVFQDAVDPFGHGVFVRVAVLGHAQGHAMAFEYAHVLAGRVLQAPVGVVNQRPVRLGAGGQGLLQRGERTAHRQVRVQASPHDFVGIQVGNQAQVAPAAEQSHVRDITDLELFGLLYRQVVNQVWPPKQGQAGLRGHHPPFAAADE